MIELKSITSSELQKLGILREYKDLDTATDNEKSWIDARLNILKDDALKQIEVRQYAEGFI